MKVSVITIVYNNKECIADCIRSVLEQTYDNIEYIVIDGGSDDGTQEVIEKYLGNIDYYVSERDGGLYSALNKGIQQASGDIVGILHSDDVYYSQDTVANVVRVFERNNEADILYAKGQYVQRRDLACVRRVYPSSRFRRCYLNLGWIPLHTTMYVRLDTYRKYGLFDESFTISSDYEISLRWFRDKKINKIYHDEWVVKMRLGGKSTSVKLQEKKSLEDLMIIRRYQLWGYLTLFFKIVRKIPQYIIPRIVVFR